MADDAVVREIEIRAPPAEVCEMFTDPALGARRRDPADLTHRGLDRAVRGMHDEGWASFLGQLKAASEA
jgi:hypothetical protein